jgi:hypothetical protein
MEAPQFDYYRKAEVDAAHAADLALHKEEVDRLDKAYDIRCAEVRNQRARIDALKEAHAADLAKLEHAEKWLGYWKKLGDGVMLENERLQAIAAELGIPAPTDRQGYEGQHTAESIIHSLREAHAADMGTIADLRAELARLKPGVDYRRS